MKLITKIGIFAVAAGAVLSAAGGIICIASPDEIALGDLGERTSYEEVIEGDISELKIEASFLNIEIRQGDEFRIVAENVPEKLAPSAARSGGVLKIANENEFKFKNVKFGGINIDSVGTYTVYIPADTLEKADIEATFCSMAISSLQAEELNIECSFGEYNISGAACSKIDADCSFSDTSLNETECEKLSYASSFGSFEAESLKITGSADFDNSFGSLEVQLIGDNYDFSSVNTIGSIDTFTCSEEEVKLSVDVAFGDAVFKN